MEMSFGLIQQQQLKLVMTPELRQSITILQYSALELTEFLKEQANENPLMEIKEPRLHDKVEYRFQYSNGQGKSDYVNPIDYFADKNVSLHEYVIEQLRYLSISSKEKKLLHFLIGNLNENGYLDVEYENLPKGTKITLDEWEKGISLLQQLEPFGIGARNLTECLLIQLQHSEWRDELCELVIRHHLPDIAAHRYQKIANKLKVSIDEVQLIADFIKGLHPKPGTLFYSKYDARFIIPDVIIDYTSDGSFFIQINDRILPRIEINSFYEEMLQQKNEAKHFLEQQLSQFQWLTKSIEQRKQTILKVTEVIIKEQKRFFEGHANLLKPLTLKEVARKLNIHESTVSRATSHKYVQTPKGIFELKHFFTNGISNAEGGTETSAYDVKELVKQLIQAESKRKPLSDQKLVQLLKEQHGITIARRTVAKYRDELGILSSALRKKIE